MGLEFRPAIFVKAYMRGRATWDDYKKEDGEWRLPFGHRQLHSPEAIATAGKTDSPADHGNRPRHEAQRAHRLVVTRRHAVPCDQPGLTELKGERHDRGG